MPKVEWKEIDNCLIRHIWYNQKTKREVSLCPDWYAKRGLPLDGDGFYLQYMRTEVLTDFPVLAPSTG